MSAYACEPGKGSEPEAGYQIALAAARSGHEVTLLTRANNVASLEGALPSNVEVVGYDLGSVALRLKRAPGGVQAYYWAWQKRVARVAEELHRNRKFDVVHHATFAVDWLPVGAVLKDVPFIWGPVGGATGLPWRLWRSVGVAGWGREIGRQVAVSTLQRYYGRRIARRADLIVAQNLDEARLWRRHASRLVVRPNVVIERPEAAVIPPPRADGLRTAIFVGRLIPHKGAIWAVRALAEAEATDWRLKVVGAGPEEERLRETARTLRVEDRVEFSGWLPRDQVMDLLATADAMVAPSFYEGSGFAVAEAVTLGCPVVGTRRGGLEVIVGQGQGVLVEADTDMAVTLAGALRRVESRHAGTEEWSAERLEEHLNSWYQAVLPE